MNGPQSFAVRRLQADGYTIAKNYGDNLVMSRYGVQLLVLWNGDVKSAPASKVAAEKRIHHTGVHTPAYCDICGQMRNAGSHAKCSKQRKAKFAEENADA